METGEELLNIDMDLEMWRDGATFMRPKWGIYRSLNNQINLRDETVLFDSFCIGKGHNVCY